MSRASGARSWAVLGGVFVVTLALVNPYLRGDGNGYYAYVRSLVIDHDLNFENEFRQGDPLFRDIYFDEQGSLRPTMRSSTGLVINQWTVGPSLLWLPFFLVAHAAVTVLNGLGAGIPADGFSAPYRWLCAIGTACYGWLSLLLMRAPAARIATPRGAILATLAIWWASSLPVYMYFLPFHVHALSACAVSLFLGYWLRASTFPLTVAAWAIWGLLAGLMIEVYSLNAVVGLVAIAELVAASFRERRLSPRIVGAGAVFAIGALISLAPQLVAKWIVHGSPFISGYRDEFFWTTPRLWQVGLSSEHGLFLWTPVTLLAIVGLVRATRRDVRVFALLIVLAVFYYTVASYQNWHGLSSFGSRFFVSLTPVFLLGAAAAADWARSSVRPIVPVLVALLVAWNLGFMFQWGTNLVPSRGPVDFATVARNQVTAVPGRLLGFARRYLAERTALTLEVEAQDRLERNQYPRAR
jgi:hypothetical protein